MADVPKFQEFMWPLLVVYANESSPIRLSEAVKRVTNSQALSDDQMSEINGPSGIPTYKNRIHWANFYLSKAGLIESEKRGYWTLSKAGKQFFSSHPKGADISEMQVLCRQIAQQERVATTTDSGTESEKNQSDTVAANQTPDDLIESSLERIKEAVSDELIAAIENSNWVFFESLVLDLLFAMGYGETRQDAKLTKRGADGGLDGIISLDKLGFQKIYVQAKKWKKENTVGRKEVQSFYGALKDNNATMGVFITTSYFTKLARESASNSGIVLVDRTRLTRLMIDFGVGVSHKPFKIPAIDNDYFDE